MNSQHMTLLRDLDQRLIALNEAIIDAETYIVNEGVTGGILFDTTKLFRSLYDQMAKGTSTVLLQHPEEFDEFIAYRALSEFFSDTNLPPI